MPPRGTPAGALVTVPVTIAACAAIAETRVTAVRSARARRRMSRWDYLSEIAPKLTKCLHRAAEQCTRKDSTDAALDPDEDRPADDVPFSDHLVRGLSILPRAPSPPDRGRCRAEIGRAHEHGRVQRRGRTA